MTDNLCHVFLTGLLYYTLRRIVQQNISPENDTKRQPMLKIALFSEDISEKVSPFVYWCRFLGYESPIFRHIFLCICIIFLNQNKGLIKLRPLFCIYLWESIIFSINIPYPFWGLFTNTCVTAPISLLF